MDILVYMLKFKKNIKFILILDVFENDKKKIDLVIEKLINFYVFILKIKFNAGADIIQIFDSWARINSTG